MTDFLNILFFAVLTVCFLATILQFAAAVFQQERLSHLAWLNFLLTFGLASAYMVLRGMAARRLPLSNQFEFSTAFAWGVALMYVFLRTHSRADWIGIATVPTTFVMLFYAALQPKEITDLMPALRSVWFGFHIGAAIFSYAAFTISGCVGAIYLVREKRGEKPVRLAQMDYLSYRLIAFGFLMLTVVILTGCVWAEQAWSAFWSWDPKEIWALITWIFYSIYLHQRVRKKWQGRRMAWYAVVAVGFVMFTFIGVNTLLPGLHSYS